MYRVIRNTLLFLVITTSIGVTLVSCKKSSNTPTTYTPDCSGTAKSFANDVSPLINSNCGSCHGAGNSRGLSILSTYSQISSDKNNIRAQIVSGSMPQNGTLTTAEKNTIVCWIDAGAKNN